MKKTVVRPGRVEKEADRKKIAVDELQIGMYVSELDRDWLGTPFLMQGFTIQTREDIYTVQEHCSYVWIDEVKQTYVPAEERAVDEAKKRKKNYINKVSASDEHRQALGVFREARRITKSLLDEARLGASVNTEAAKSTVNECVQSILRNPDALTWMSKMRNEDEYTAEHCLNVCILAISFGRHLGYEEEALQHIGLCGLLHDVGKMKIPPEILNKPDRLTDKEFKMIKAHTVHGRNLLMTAPGSYHGVVDVAYSHHERLDGNGYPRGLKASGISEFSRIVAIADAYDAMTAKRVYEDARSSTDALKEIFDNRGTQFDERLAEQFLEMVGLYPPGSIVEMTNGCVGIVLTTNHKYRHLPKVLVVRNTVKRPVKEKVLNLADCERGTLDKSFLIKRVLVDGAHNVSLKAYKDRGLQFSFN
ncbi:MAG: metal-dependent phosphohydrolase [Cellvibrionaceae bacterium]|nr:metal-dependent phosphohydrolase [Cellvibrionaceae bacterium]